MKLLLGVDGGGTKADYGLFTKEGELIDYLHTTSRSHESLAGGFEEAEVLMLKDLDYLMQKHGINPSDVTAAFGLAGIDTPAQRKIIEASIQKVGFADFVVSNDSVLGIKAGCPSGIGICSINGTGTVASGINEQGDILQVGGIGMVTGDYAGGGFLSTLAVNSVYNYYERCGEYTVMVERIMKVMEADTAQDLLERIYHKFIQCRDQDKMIVTILMESALEGDKIAAEIVKKAALEMAKSVSGCIQHLAFKKEPDVVLAGSLWTKVKNPLMLETFIENVNKYSGYAIKPRILDVVPMVGAVIWALELSQNAPATHEQRECIRMNMKNHISAKALK